MDDPDLALVRALQAGDDEALNELMARHKEAIFGFVLRLVPRTEDAEEIAHKTFVRAYFKIRLFRPRALFKTWLFRIALNLCRDHLRRRGPKSETWSLDERSDTGQYRDLPSPTSNPREDSEARELVRELEKAIEQLPRNLKVPLLLTALNELSYNEAAAILHTSTKTIEMRVYRARKVLLEAMRKSGF
jgi:RNA polymerase sigma factor (sigma-70 family)